VSQQDTSSGKTRCPDEDHRWHSRTPQAGKQGVLMPQQDTSSRCPDEKYWQDTSSRTNKIS